MNTYYQLSTGDVIKHLNTSFTGLSDETVAALQKKYGANVLTQTKQKSRLAILLGQFADIMILILIGAAVVSFIAGEHIDACVILAIIIANAWMGYSQEYNAEKSILLLQQMDPRYALVIRNNNPVKLVAAELVPGDIMLLNAGDIVPADGRLIAVHSLLTAEASLTGESNAVEKHTNTIAHQNLVPGDQLNMVFKGTLVSAGSAKAVVTAIGMDTELGKIAGMLSPATQQTPLQKRLAVFSKQLSVVVIIICLLVFALGLWRGEPAFQMFLTALSLAVAALPEALPAVITIALAQGARRMAKQKALIRKLPAVETLGSVTYICTDKTGTLTQNSMQVENLYAAPGLEDLLLHAMLLNNEISFAAGGLLGDPTEKALVDYAMQHGILREAARNQFPGVAKLPFDSERMKMSTLHKHGNRWILFVKGAPVKMLESLDEKSKPQIPEWQTKNRQWAADGLRVLILGYRIFDQPPAVVTNEIETGLELLGMVAMIDPPRPEIIDAISQCKTAGIRTVMITGDQPLTAAAIAARMGITGATYDGIKTGADLNDLAPEEFAGIVKSTLVYARVSPKQKLHIVQQLQKLGEFVAMTGDGVNDAPSLKQADIGIAMGITGTDVSKESADMILLDDNFATIVNAVREGRRIYDNIRKFILYVLACNLGEILTIFMAPLFGFSIPMLPIHLLWINLVTDGFPGLALVGEPAEKNIMQKPPRPPGENLFAGGLAVNILFTGVIITIATLSVQWWAVRQGYDVKAQQTMVFTTLCFVQLGNALSVRSFQFGVFSRSLFANQFMWVTIVLTVALQLLIVFVPGLQTVFKTTAVPGNALGVVGLATLVSVMCTEGFKRLKFRP
ncbi:MAG: calcium-translocating P-type ATPase, PMCA-type [Ferruginibacter sp.]|uniref:cation-translocating P-type ATPase n=1 Tax=Ferruginibacter sp. TaxID=1940288 RepID=UPI0026583A0C|nr:cation-translocating P-type ATPase [Ferruginibacter sp.]MDB5277538.1 calcium-translocating P-type ATPase, PMCA-type [Ferruginibacter sp.]